jgi:hypothetical protein
MEICFTAVFGVQSLLFLSEDLLFQLLGFACDYVKWFEFGLTRTSSPFID